MKPPLTIQTRCAVRNFRPSRWPEASAEFGRRAWGKVRGHHYRVGTLEPAGPPTGRVLISYILDPFFLSPGRPMPVSHTHFWECRTMAEAFVEAGYAVDVIRWANRRFEPAHGYDVLVDVRLNLERLGPKMPPTCLKIMHAETAHHAFHNAAQQQRLDALEERRGIRLPPYKMIEPNQAIGVADEATVLGNAFTMSTYAFAGKPLHRIPISCPYTYPSPAEKDFAAAARRFVWFGSDGFVHKGLDRVLEAFAGLPDHHLTVCGPLAKERAFQQAFYRELYQTPNIHTVGWVDVGGDRFRSICDRAAALVYPTCSEGGGGSVINCMHAGLIPMIPDEASVDFDAECGVRLTDPSVEGLRAAVRELGARPPTELRAMAVAAHARANRDHTRETFAAAYRDRVGQWLGRSAAASAEGGTGA